MRAAIRSERYKMAPDGTENLSPEQLKALAALLEHGDKAKVARAAKVGRTTLYRWLREDANFQAALEGATRQAILLQFL
jgi:DNA-binding phage protein